MSQSEQIQKELRKLPPPKESDQLTLALSKIGLGTAGAGAGGYMTLDGLKTIRNGYRQTQATQALKHSVNDAAKHTYTLRDSDHALKMYIAQASAAETLSRLSDQASVVDKSIVPDSLRQDMIQEFAKTVGSPISDVSKIKDTSINTIDRLRSNGVLDYDMRSHFLNNPNQLNHLRNYVQGQVNTHTPKLFDAGMKLRGMGALKFGIGTMTTAASLLPIVSGAKMLSNSGQVKAASQQENDYTTAGTVARSLMVAPGAFLAGSGISSLINPNMDVAVSYGTADPLGAGHKAPGVAIKGILSRDENSAAFKNLSTATKTRLEDTFKNSDIVDLAMGQDSITSTNTPALNRKFNLAIDTGWGLWDKTKGLQSREGWQPGGPKYIPRAVMADVSQYNRGRNYAKDENIFAALNGTNKTVNTEKLFFFQPDSPSKISGASVDTNYSHTPFLDEMLIPWSSRKVRYFTYGDPDQKGTDRTKFIGPGHPATNLDLSPALTRDAYKKLLAKELAVSNSGTTAEHWLQEIGDRKIVTISGASRGDSVGARFALLQEAIDRAKMQDDIFIVGMGGKNKNIEETIGRANGIQGAKGGFTGFTKNFVPLAQNSDLHMMGMGGATPPEMAGSFGTAPIIRHADEQMFTRKLNITKDEFFRDYPWLDAQWGPKSIYWGNGNDAGAEITHPIALDTNAGLLGKQRELVESAVKKLGPTATKAEIDSLRQSFVVTPRSWMNALRVVDKNDEVIWDYGKDGMHRGLDGNHDFLDRHGLLAPINVSDASVMDDLLRKFKNGELKGIDNTTRTKIQKELADSREGLANLLITQHKNGLLNQRIKGVAKLGGGMAMLAPLAMQVHDLAQIGKLQKSAGAIWPNTADAQDAINIEDFLKNIKNSKKDILEDAPKPIESTGDKWLTEAQKETLKDVGMGGLGLTSAFSGGHALHAFSAANAMQNEVSTWAKKVNAAGPIKDTWQEPSNIAALLDSYGEHSQKLMKSRPLGIISNTQISKLIPVSQAKVGIDKYPKVTLSYALGNILPSQRDRLDNLLIDKNDHKSLQFRKTLDKTLPHYIDMQRNPHYTLGRELKEDITAQFNDTSNPTSAIATPEERARVVASMQAIDANTLNGKNGSKFSDVFNQHYNDVHPTDTWRNFSTNSNVQIPRTVKQQALLHWAQNFLGETRGAFEYPRLVKHLSKATAAISALGLGASGYHFYKRLANAGKNLPTE